MFIFPRPENYLLDTNIITVFIIMGLYLSRLVFAWYIGWRSNPDHPWFFCDASDIESINRINPHYSIG